MCEAFRGGVRSTGVRIKAFLNACDGVFIESKTWSMIPHYAIRNATM